MKDAVPKVLFVFALASLVYSYGFISYRYELFPYQIIQRGYLAASAFIEVRSEKLDEQNVDFWDETGIATPRYRSVTTSAGSEPILILGNDLPYANKNGENGYLAWIADRDGRILHAWKDIGEIWAPLQKRDAIGDYWRSYPVGAYLYPNGDLLISYHGTGMFPVSMGLAKFDKDSNLLWKRDDYYHHWFSVADNGHIYIPDQKFADSPLRIPDYEKTVICDKTRFVYDTLAVLDADGNEIREIDMLQALVASDLNGLIHDNVTNQRIVESCDLLHLNDAVLLREDQLADFPGFSAGDLLVSFRTLNAVAVLDPVSARFKWHAVGSSHHQHSPRFQRENTILVFDNYGSRVSRGMTRILSVDVESRRTATVFPKDGTDLPELPFASATAGYIDLDPSGQRMLVSFTHQGLVWEIDTESGEILWEFVDTHPVKGKPARVSVYTAKYAGALNFELNSGNIR